MDKNMKTITKIALLGAAVMLLRKVVRGKDIINPPLVFTHYDIYYGSKLTLDKEQKYIVVISTGDMPEDSVRRMTLDEINEIKELAKHNDSITYTEFYKPYKMKA